jgi:hypothetical protein
LERRRLVDEVKWSNIDLSEKGIGKAYRKVSISTDFPFIPLENTKGELYERDSVNTGKGCVG